MARVTLIVAGPARGAGSLPRVSTADADTVQDLVSRVQPHPTAGPHPSGRPICFVNGQDTRFAPEHDTRLADGDTVTFVYPATDS
jgi:molybdopterin converting factor small subunit